MARCSGRFGFALLALLGAALPLSAHAAPLVYEYQIKHPTYGNIGSYVNVVNRSGSSVDVTTSVRVRVKVFGIAVFREEADRTEHWEGGRLVRFHGITVKNGKRFEVSGEARGDDFVVTGPEGVFVAPANVQPPNPLSIDCLKSNAMMSSVTGRIYPARIVDGGEDVVNLDGRAYPTRKYEIDTDRPHVVWFDGRGVPLMVQSVEHGDNVRLVLTHYPLQDIHVAEAPQH